MDFEEFVDQTKEKAELIATNLISPEILGIIGLIVTFAGILPGLADWTLATAGLMIMSLAAMFHEHGKNEGWRD